MPSAAQQRGKFVQSANCIKFQVWQAGNLMQFGVE